MSFAYFWTIFQNALERHPGLECMRAQSLFISEPDIELSMQFDITGLSYGIDTSHTYQKDSGCDSTLSCGLYVLVV